MNKTTFPKLTTDHQDEVYQILTESLQDITSDYPELLPQGWYATLQVRLEEQTVFEYTIDSRTDKKFSTRTRTHIYQLQKTNAQRMQDAFLVHFRLKSQAGATDSVSTAGNIGLGFAGAEDDEDNIFFATSMLKTLLNYLRRDNHGSTLELNLADPRHDQLIASALNKFRIPPIIEF